MGILICGLKSQPVHFPYSNSHRVVEGKKSGNSQGTIPGLCLSIEAQTIHGSRRETSDTSSARQLRFAYRNPTVRATFLARQSSPLPRRLAIPGKPRRFQISFVFIYPLSELLKVRGVRVMETHSRLAQHVRFSKVS